MSHCRDGTFIETGFYSCSLLLASSRVYRFPMSRRGIRTEG
jgi:hypothetical protein